MWVCVRVCVCMCESRWVSLFMFLSLFLSLWYMIRSGTKFVPDSPSVRIKFFEFDFENKNLPGSIEIYVFL